MLDITKSDVYLGNALDLLKELPEKSVRLCLTDVPYVISRPNTLDKMGRRGIDFGEWDKTFDNKSWLTLLEPALLPGGSVVIFCDWKKITQIVEILESLNLEPRRLLEWHKLNPFPRNIKRTFVQGSEYAIWATKKDKKIKWVFNKRPDKPYERGQFKYPVQHSEHQAAKPKGMACEIIEILSNSGELVLDPFAGSGAFAYGAELTGRRHISFEMEQKSFDLAKKTIAEAREIMRLTSPPKVEQKNE